ncbi:SOS response-associated peptidase [Sneathiella marina]|uniref:Abasic site processing protein n=1 Tax=Sneathiella marina TaxID=2950108 RepID=A0ABY4VZJ3_9PROT|nr:SOS response-associated peptidase [Sneathiella marina]USG60357.1 SOS response-associated peptidase [Sneathiella marina]
MLIIAKYYVDQVVKMCGRFNLTSPVEAIRQLFGFQASPNLQARYNIAPTTQIAAVRLPSNKSASGTELFSAHWGLIPSWAKSAEYSAKMINARSETVADKPAFRSAYKSRRCLIPSNGFYEWQKLGKTKKQPWLISLQDTPLFAFAGLWESWTDPEGKTLESCTILTTKAADSIAFIHHRMPVIIDKAKFGQWYEGGSEDDLLQPFDSAKLTFHKVSQSVGNVRNDDASLIAPCESITSNPQQELF